MISNFTTDFPVAAQTTYANNVSVTGGSPTVAVAASTGAPVITMGTLTMAAGSALNVVADTGTPADLAYGLTFGATTLSGSATFNVANNGAGAGTLTLGPVGGASGSVTKTGAGTLVLTGAGTYGGGTTVSAGSLLVQNQSSGQSGTGTGTVNVANGATLGGTGRVAPASGNSVILTDGGRLFLQASATESLRIATSGGGALVLGTSNTAGQAGVVAFKIVNDPGPSAPANSGGSTLGSPPLPTNHGFVTIDGIVSLTSGLKVEIDGSNIPFTIGQPYSYQIGQINDWAGGTQTFNNPASFSTIGFSADPGSISFQIGSTGLLLMNFTPVPEPTGLLALGGAAALAVVRRRRRTG